jgi:hypothetical protein
MPLELGLFLGAKRYGNTKQKAKRVLILDVEEHRYQRFISDLAGMDVHGHAGDPMRALCETRDWLANVSRRELPSGYKVQRIYQAFLGSLPAIAEALEFAPDHIPYFDYERILANWLVEAPATMGA